MNKQGCRIATALLGFREGFRDYFSNRMRASTAVTYRDVVAVWEQTVFLRFYRNNWIETILVDCYLGEPARRCRRFRASGNKNITLAYLCIALSVSEEHNKNRPQTCSWI